jgi:hypothetical protein
MAALSNLVPAPDSADEWVGRPAAILFANSNTKTPGFISCYVVVGTHVLGLISSSLHAGYDEPFCYDLLGNAFLTVSGITGTNVPVSPPTTGAWQPPHAELIGVYVVLTSVGYSGTGTNFFGMINTSNFSALTYNSYQISAGTGGTQLPSVPVWCTQFNSRAYFFVNPTNAPPATILTDVNSPSTFFSGTTAPYNNVFTYGGNYTLTCGGTVSFDNQLGGQTQSLIVFQGERNMWQVTGDPAAVAANVNIDQGPLAINSLNVATGTLAPNTVCQTPKGLAFVAPDGLRIIDFNAHVSDPVGYDGKGICVPFMASAVPSRMCAACNSTTIRISTINGAVINSPQQEWCFDISRGAWHGPHTFPVSLIAFYGISFVAAPLGIGGLWSTDVVPNSNSTYTENGSQITCTWTSGFFPDRPKMTELSSVRSVMYQAYGPGTTVFSVSALDVNNNVLPGGFAQMSFMATVTLWDQFAWGSSVWLGSSANLSASQIPWTAPLIFDRVAIQISVIASAGMRIGNFLMEYDEEAYTVLTS